MIEDHVVTAFLRHDGEILLARRSDAVGTYTGQWGGVSGFAEGNPDEQVRVEITEETGLESDTSTLVRSGRQLEVEDAEYGRTWVVHPYLFDCETREVDLSEEHDAVKWVSPTAMLVDDEVNGNTVPGLWNAYERVAPTVRSIAADDDHGAAWLSLRGLEVVRDRAAILVDEREGGASDPVEEWDELTALAERVLEVRPSMAVLRNRINRAMAAALSDATETRGGEGADGATEDPVPCADAVLEETIEGIDRAATADTDAAREASDRLEGTVMTLSRSGTVLEALRTSDVRRIYVAESRPGLEGVAVAESLVDDHPVTVHTDAAAASLLAREEIDRVVVGADTIHAGGAVINKTGTRGLAVAADREDVPVTVVTASDKVTTREKVPLESGSRSTVYDGDAPVDVANPTFDVTPADCVTEVVTERGALEPADVDSLVEELRELEGWLA
ncbi:NUDIX domain-containing protein [Natronosalvus vescus]|uniref:NUDIX domain-containing protein n=1 Tax=Natronosalvus vescus TaxID=2953881 RepID=UPI0020916060|nr:NUDIX domain-containing protein [Natronosalvus vescus]